MEVWLVRHGETFANTQKIIQGQQGGELTEKGFEQAKCVGQRLSKEKFERIFCSDLNRTVQTAQQITVFHETTDFQLDERLREKSGGDLEGLPLITFKREADKAKKGIREFKPSKGESWQDVMNRAKSFLNDLAAEYLSSSKPSMVLANNKLSKSFIEEEKKEEQKSENINKILVITHGGFIMEFMNAVRTLQSKSPIFNNCAKNTAIYVIRFQNKEVKGKKGLTYKIVPQIIVENDNSHLTQLKKL